MLSTFTFDNVDTIDINYCQPTVNLIFENVAANKVCTMARNRMPIIPAPWLRWILNLGKYEQQHSELLSQPPPTTKQLTTQRNPLNGQP